MSSNTNIGNTPVNQGYVQLVHMGETGGIDGTLRTLYDGDGTASDLQIASNKVKISTELYIGSKTITEYVQDIVGSMFTTGSYTNITTTYDDTNGNIDLSASGEVTLTGTQTLTNKTLASPTFTGTANGANLTLTGDLTVSGDTIFTNSNTVLIGDAILTLNADETGSPTANAGFEVERGTSTNKTFIWNETDDKWTIGSETFVASTFEGNLTGNVTGNVTGSASLNLLKSSNLSDLASASTARSNLGVDAAGTDNSTNVTLVTTSHDYLSLSGQAITLGTIDISDDTNLVGGTGITLTGDTLSTTDSEIVHDNLSGFVSNEHIDHSGVSISAGSGLTGGGNITATRTLSLDVNNLDTQVPALELADKIAIYDNSATETNVATLTQLKAIVNTDTNTNQLTEFTLSGDSGSDQTISHGNTLEISGGNGISTSTSATDILSVALGGFSALTLESSPAEQDLLALEDAIDGTTKKVQVGALTSGAVTSYTNTGNDRVLTSGGGTTINGESNLTFDGTNLDLPDSKKVRFGTGNDLEIYHDGTNSVINNTTGDLQIYNNADDKDIVLLSDDGSGGTTAYLTLNGSASLIDFDKASRYMDSVWAYFGTGLDFKVGHDGSNAYIANDTTGDLYIQNDLADRDVILRSDDGSGGTTAYLTLDGSATRVDVSQDLRIPVDNKQFKIGAGEDLLLYHDGSNTHIQSNTAPLIINQVANSTMEFKTNNTSAMTINASQNVGIGTSSPSHEMVLRKDQAAETEFSIVNLTSNSSAKTNLRFRNATSGSESGNGALIQLTNGNDFKILNQFGNNLILGTSNAEKMRITGAGNVGIGTASPEAKLDIVGNSDSVAALKLGSNATHGFHFFERSTEGDLRIKKEVSGSLADVINIARSDGDVGFYNNVGIGTNSPGYKLDVAGQGKVTNGWLVDNGTTAGFFTTDSDNVNFGASTSGKGLKLYSANAEAMRIDSSGNVGIGTASLGASAKLNVVSGSSAYTAQFSRLDGDDGLFLHSEAAGTHYNWLITTQDNVDKGFEITPSTGVGNRTFSTPAFVIKADTGNVGLGTNSPEGKVHIYNGDASVAPDGDADELVVENSSRSGISILSGESNGHTGSLLFGSASDAFAAGVVWSYYNKTLTLKSQNSNGIVKIASANNSLAMTIDTSQDIKIEQSLGIGVAASSTTGRLDCSNDVVAYSTSDKRLKENIKPLDNALDKVLKISGVEFDWKELTEEEKKTIHGNEGHDVGVIAQEIEEVLPEVVTERDTGYKAVKYEKIVPILIEAIKEQQKQIEELKNGYSNR